MFVGRRIVVTGGTGSWGHELVRQLLPHNPSEIIVYSRNESSQVEMSQTFDDPRISFRIGDIRDREALADACAGADVIFHLAALKHVPVCEEQPYEALKTNVSGTQNVIEAAIKNKVGRVIYVSTDKAVNPSNFYGMTKAIGEKLMIYANLQCSDTKFVCVRGGNVLGTNGSVVHLFRNQITHKKQITLTHRDMTRFFLTLDNVIRQLIKASVESVGGEIFVMKMPACRIVDLADVMIEAMGKQVGIIETGVRPGERVNEILLTEQESLNAVIFDDHNLVILPGLNIPGLRERYAAYPRAPHEGFSSTQSLMSKEEIHHMLSQAGLLS